jgi:hypothetical protein
MVFELGEYSECPWLGSMSHFNRMGADEQHFHVLLRDVDVEFVERITARQLN